MVIGFCLLEFLGLPQKVDATKTISEKVRPIPGMREVDFLSMPGLQGGGWGVAVALPGVAVSLLFFFCGFAVACASLLRCRRPQVCCSVASVGAFWLGPWA